MTNPVTIATQGKGYSDLIKRIRTITRHYGFTVKTMDQALRQFVKTLQAYGCGATFPITASTLARYGSVIEKYQRQNIEFAMHGLFHVDYSQLSLAEQQDHLKRAYQIFNRENINLTGFRCPYLRWNKNTLTAVGRNDLGYDSSQALHWDVVDGHATEAYQHALGFYRAKSADDHPALPKIVGQIVQIPYCIPDDEALIDRLKLVDTAVMSDIWLAILSRTYELGELFTVGLHPERIGILQEPLSNVLAQARRLSPKVWIARLDEITTWWRARSETSFRIEVETDDIYYLSIAGPPGTALLVRNVDVRAPVKPWHNDFNILKETSFRVQSSKRPWIGLSSDSSPAVLSFLKEQGYLVETSVENQAYSIYLRQNSFFPEDERPLLDRLDRSEQPLIRLGTWPDGARSALCITGDIDALTLWDYALRFLGK